MIKKRITLVPLLFLCLNLGLFAQERNEYKDLIKVRYEDKMLIEIYMFNYADQYNSMHSIYNDFLSVFQRISDSALYYPPFLIEYKKGDYLNISRQNEVNKYLIGKDQEIKTDEFINKLILQDWRYRIEIRFSKISYLYDTTIQRIIINCMEDLPKSNRWSTTFQYTFQNNMLSRLEDYRIKQNVNYWYDMVYAAQFGIIDGRIASGICAGVGYLWTIKDIDKLFLYTTVSSLSSYNDNSSTLDGIGHYNIGLRYKTMPSYGQIGSWFGLEYGIPINKNMQFLGKNISFKTGIALSMGKNTWLHLENFKIKGTKESFSLIGIGIGL